MNTPEKLRQILQDAQWSQEELARQLGVPFTTLSRWLHQHSTPRPFYQEKINNLYLGISGNDNINPDMLRQVTSSALNCRLTVSDLLSNQSWLDSITLHLTYHTNTIEGSTMTFADVQEILSDDNLVLHNKTAREQIEARNHRAALYFLLDRLQTNGQRFHWSHDIILGVHLRLMNTLLSDAGEFRRYGVRILGSHIPLANPASILPKLDLLLQDLNTPTSPPIIHLANTHARFEQIHPFSDGNGRVGRLILLAQALRFGLMPPLVLKERKHAYYKYLELAQIDDNPRPLQQFIAESILSTDEIIHDN